MPAHFDELLPSIIAANDAGLTLAAIRKKFAGTSKTKAKERKAELEKRLDHLVREGMILGPVKHGRSQYYFVAGHGPEIEVASLHFDKLLPSIIAANDAGLTLKEIKQDFKANSGKRKAELEETLDKLVREGTILGPFKKGSSQRYFAAGCGPKIEGASSIETASKTIEQAVRESGVKLLSKTQLGQKVKGKVFDDGLSHAIANRRIVELTCGASKYYFHCETAAEYFDFEAVVPANAGESPKPLADETKALTFNDILPVYRRLKAEQGGFSTVKIFDLIKVLGCQQEPLHELLIAEAKTGRITIHHTTSVEHPPEEIDAAIRLPGFAEPFVTFVVKGEL